MLEEVEAFDIDNRDIEAEMLIQDIESEESEEEEKAEDEEAEESVKQANKLRKVLSARNLEFDLARNNEKERVEYTFKKDGQIYIGYVVSKMNKDKFIFNVKQPEIREYKLKAFTLSDLK